MSGDTGETVETKAEVPEGIFYPDGRVTSEVRLNYSCSTPEIIDEGIQRLARAIR